MIFFHGLKEHTAFPICFNLLPHYTAAEQHKAELMNFVEKALEDSRIRTFLLTDRPARPQGFSSMQLAKEILEAGGEALISLALTFDNRQAVIQKLVDYQQIGARHFIIVTGEYPSANKEKQQKPVFDLDSVQLLMLLQEVRGAADMFKGCAVSPFKSMESEQVWQYEKLKRKISVGADFVVTQLGYDIRKFDELIKFCSFARITAPLVANIIATNLHSARLVQETTINGVHIPDRLLSTLRDEETDPQAAGQNRITRTAKLMAVLKGLGYHGVLLGGDTSSFSEVKRILDESEILQPGWQNYLSDLDFAGQQFYYFQKNSQTGLNSNYPTPVTPKHKPSLLYSFSYFVDWLVYVPQGPLFKITGRFCHFCSNSKFWYTFIWLQEFLSKRLLYGCKMCGDCLLYACGFLCYRAGCPKSMANGPCGGSKDGYCEVLPDKKTCYWVKVYNNMKGAKQHVTFVAPPIPCRDTSLDRTSSWINFFLGKDHRKLKPGSN
jgi:methylenetetrahydrofolate reductase (NADPH)